MLFFVEEIYFLFYTEVSVVKPVKFTQDSGLARDEFLVIFGSYPDIHVRICNYCVIAGHCIALH